MAEPLTWRNVGAPNLGDAIVAQGMAGRFLNNAFEGFNRSLGQFDNWRTEQNDRLALAAATQIQDPAAYQEALRNGTALGGIDPRLISARTQMAIDGRATDLISRAANQFTLDTNRRNDAAEQAAGPIAAAYQAALARGDTAAAQRIAAESQRVVGALPLQAQERLFSAGSRLETAGVQNAQTRQQTAQQAWNFALAQSNEADRRTAQAFESDLRDTTWSYGDAIQALEARRSSMTPGAYALAQRAVEARFPEAFATSAGIPGGGGGGAQGASLAGGGGAGTRAVNAATAGAAATVGGVNPQDFPLAETRNHATSIINRARAAGVDVESGSPQEIADRLLPFLGAQESGNRQTDAQGRIITSSAGAQGQFQLMPGTARELERTLGMRPGLTSETTPEGQAANQRAGRHYLTQMLQRYGGNAALALAAYNAGPGRVDNWITGQRVGQNVTALTNGRTGPDGQQIPGVLPLAQEVNNRLVTLRAQTRGNSIMGQIARAQTENLDQDVIQVRDGLREAFPDVSQGAITGAIRRVMELDPRITPAMAGVILRNNVTENHFGILNTIAPGDMWGRSSTDFPELGSIRANVRDYFNTEQGGAGSRIQRDNQIQARAQQIQQAQQRVQQIAADLQALNQRVQSTGNTALARGIPARELALAEAERALRTLLETTNADSTYNLQGGANFPPEPTPVARNRAVDLATTGGATRGFQATRIIGDIIGNLSR